MSGQNKTFNATNKDDPAILRWNIELQLLILVVGGAAHVFYLQARYPGQKCIFLFVLATHDYCSYERLNKYCPWRPQQRPLGSTSR